MIKMNKSQNYHLVQIAGQADGAKSEKLIFGRIHHSMKIHRPCFFILSYQYISTIHQIAMADIRLQKMSIQTLCVYENAKAPISPKLVHLHTSGQKQIQWSHIRYIYHPYIRSIGHICLKMQLHTLEYKTTCVCLKMKKTAFSPKN